MRKKRGKKALQTQGPTSCSSRIELSTGPRFWTQCCLARSQAAGFKKKKEFPLDVWRALTLALLSHSGIFAMDSHAWKNCGHYKRGSTRTTARYLQKGNKVALSLRLETISCLIVTGSSNPQKGYSQYCRGDLYAWEGVID